MTKRLMPSASGSSVSIYCQCLVFQIGDEHVAWRMRDHKGRFGLHRHRLRCHTAGPEDRHLARSDGHRIAEVGLGQVCDSQRGWIAYLDWSAMGGRKPGCGLNCPRNEVAWDWSHADDEWPLKDAGRLAGPRGDIHRDVFPLLKVPHGNPRPEHRCLEGKATAQQKAHQVSPPNRHQIGDLVLELAVAVDPISREVLAQIGARCGLDGFGRAELPG
jgi:hypothetical protein